MMVGNLFLVLLLLLVCLLAGLVLIVLGWRGRPTFTAPRCGKCGYDLRGVRFDQPGEPEGQAVAATGQGQCPECGNDLSGRKAVQWGRYEKGRKKLIAGAALAVLPGLLIAASLVGFMSFGRMVGGPPGANTPTATLITSLATTADEPWTWQELEARLGAGTLTRQQAVDAVDQLIAHLEAKHKQDGHIGPLSWSGGFLTAAIASGSVSDEQYNRLCLAYYGHEPELRMPAVRRPGGRVSVRVEYAGHWGLPGVQSVKAVREVRVDGEPVEVLAEDGRPASAAPDVMSRSGPHAISFTLPDLEPGEHEVAVVVDAGVLPEDVPLVGQHGRPGPKERWIRPRHTWQIEAAQTIRIVPEGEPLVALTTDAALDPGSVISVKQATVLPNEGGRGVVLRVGLDRAGAPPVAVACDVLVRVNG